MDVICIFPHGFAQVCRQVFINNDVMMAFAFIDTFFCRLYFNAFSSHTNFYRASNHGSVRGIGDRHGVTGECTSGEQEER